MRLTARVVLTVALLAVGIVMLDSALTRWALEQRFLRYVHVQEREALDRIAARLAHLHDLRGGLAGLDGRRLMRALRRTDSDGHVERRDRGERGERAGHDPDPARQEGPPRRRGAREASEEDEDADDGPGLHDGYRFLASMAPRLRIETDAEGVVLAPRLPYPTDADLVEVGIVAGGVRIGRVQLLPAPAPSRAADQRFVRELTRIIGWIALLAALVGSAVGWILSRRLLQPVAAVTEGARALARGDFEVRLPTHRSDELGDLARDFNLLAGSLEKAREARQRWLADVAHELRTPLAVLQAELHALRDGVRVADDAAIGSLTAEIERLGRLVDDLHQLSLADAGALDYRFEAVDPVACIREACARFEVRLGDAGLELRLELPAELPPRRLDVDRMSQLLGNLLENALRYSDAPGIVRVRLDEDDEGLHVEVADSAPGVPAAQAEALFDRFARVEASRSREHGGAGLGLAIVRSIAEAHGGRVGAGPSELGGLAVRVDLPPADAPPGGTPS